MQKNGDEKMKKIRIMAAGLILAGTCGAFAANAEIEKAESETAQMSTENADGAELGKNTETSELSEANGEAESLSKKYVEEHIAEIRSGTFSSSLEDLPECLSVIKKGSLISVAITDKAPDLKKLAETLDDYETDLNLSECTGLKEIPEKAFYMKRNIRSAVLPASVEKIGAKSFSRTSLKSVEIPSSVKELGDFAFAGTNITEANIPSGIAKYGVSPFAENKSLKAINADSGSQILKSDGGVLFTRDGLTLVSYPAGKEGSSYEVPSTVVSIGTEAFAYNEAISNVKLPASLLRICGYAFKGCKSISEIELPSALVSIGQDAFDGTSIKTISIPKATVALGKNPFNGCERLSEISVEEGNPAYKSEGGVLQTNDGSTLVRYPPAKQAGDLSIPDGTVEIAPYAFEGNKSIDSVAFAAGTKIISKYAFKNCASLKKIDGTEQLVKIGRQAFYGCPVENLPSYYVGNVDSYAPSAVDAK